MEATETNFERDFFVEIEKLLKFGIETYDQMVDLKILKTSSSEHNRLLVLKPKQSKKLRKFQREQALNVHNIQSLHSEGPYEETHPPSNLF